MKSIAYILLLFALPFVFSVGTNAQSVVNTELLCGELKDNHLFEITVCAKSDELLCGGEYELVFNSEVIEYRKVSSDLFDVKAKGEADKVSVVFACADGVDVKEDTELFTLQFKCIAQGDFCIKLKSVECVNKALKKLTVNTDEHTLSVAESSVKLKKAPHKSKTEKAENIEAAASSDELSATADYIELDSSLSGKKLVSYGVYVGAAVVIMFLMGAMFGGYFLQKKKSQNDKNNVK